MKTEEKIIATAMQCEVRTSKKTMSVLTVKRTAWWRKVSN